MGNHEHTENHGHIGSHEHTGFISEGLHELLENMGLSHEWTECIVHFFTDAVNIFLILFTVMFAVAFLRVFFNFEKLEQRLAKLKSVWGFLLAAGMGVLSPFCSCTIVPVVIGLLSMGVPPVICICFLTAASLLNITALISFYSIAGAFYTAGYIGIALFIIAAACALIVLFGLNRREYVLFYEEKDEPPRDGCCCRHDHGVHAHSLKECIKEALHGVWHVFRGSWIYILLGVALSSVVMAFVPNDTITGVISGNNVISVILAGVIGAPIHSDMFTIMPLVLILKDISVSVTLTFAAASMVISVPEILLLSRAFRPKFLAAYAAFVTVLAIAAGLIVYAMGF